MTLARADIQGNILRGYRHHGHAAYVFATVRDAGRARRLLARLAPELCTEEDWNDTPDSTLNLAFTYPGLQALEADTNPFEQFEDFSQGMYNRARAHLGDRGDNDPDTWPDELGRGAHVLFTIYARQAGARDAAVRRLEGRLRRGGMGKLHRQDADLLAEHREHFGFKDGFSQPAIAEADGDRRPPKGEGVELGASELWAREWRRLRRGQLRQLRLDRWQPVKLGEFLLGHEDEDEVRAGGEAPILRNGTFMVWRKLEQHVDTFRRWLEAHAGADPAAQETLKARIVGRWPDGPSLVKRPPDEYRPTRGARDEPSHSAKSNNFDYGEDPGGVRCPIGAHVRRAYPRDGLGWRTERTRRNRIIRRGMPYGDERSSERGLIFVCFNASISRQFEQIQRNWLSDGDTFGLGPERDFLTGGLDRAGDVIRMTIQGHRSRPPQFVTRDEPFLTVRGGYYLFVPGIGGLAQITGLG